MAPNVVCAGPIIKHVFEACRVLSSCGSARGNLSVGCPIVWQQFDHMFYNRTPERVLFEHKSEHGTSGRHKDDDPRHPRSPGWVGVQADGQTRLPAGGHPVAAAV